MNTRKGEQHILYLSRPSGFNSVLLKVVKVVLTHNGKSLDTYAILDDGSERTMLLSSAAEMLGLHGGAESLALRTIRQGTEKIEGTTVSFSISSASNQHKKYEIKDAFTAKQLDLPEQTYPVTTLQRCYQHLQGLPLQEFNKIRPLLLVGADNSHLLCSVERVRFGPPGSPAALRTCLGWSCMDRPPSCKTPALTPSVFSSLLLLKTSYREMWKDCGRSKYSHIPRILKPFSGPRRINKPLSA